MIVVLPRVLCATPLIDLNPSGLCKLRYGLFSDRVLGLGYHVKNSHVFLIWESYHHHQDEMSPREVRYRGPLTVASKYID